MSAVLLTILLAVIAFTWVRRSQTARRSWLERVRLPGHWVWQEGAAESALELSGGPAGGRYVATQATGQAQRGHWTLHGALITFVPDGGRAVDCDFRAFEYGSIGIDGPGWERRIYRRRASNVVPLRGRQ